MIIDLGGEGSARARQRYAKEEEGRLRESMRKTIVEDIHSFDGDDSRTIFKDEPLRHSK